MGENENMVVSGRLDALMASSEDPREVLTDLIREHGLEMTARVARIVFGSWRTRVDEVERVLNDILAEHGRSDL